MADDNEQKSSGSELIKPLFRLKFFFYIFVLFDMEGETRIGFLPFSYFEDTNLVMWWVEGPRKWRFYWSHVFFF